MTTVTSRGLTVAEYLAGEWPPRSQLIDGEVIANDPSFRHQRLVVYLLLRLTQWVDAGEGRGEAGLGSNWIPGPEGNLYVPDAWWVTEGRRPPGEAVAVHAVPDLVAEVRSPATWRYDIGKKRSVYEQAGVAELWLVDTASDTVIVERRSSPQSKGFDVDLLELGTGQDLNSPLLPGFVLPLSELFAR